MPLETSRPTPKRPPFGVAERPGGSVPVESLMAAPRPMASILGTLQRPCAQAGAIGFAGGGVFGDVADGVGAGIAISGGVRGAANADAVENAQDGAGHGDS